jgi:hypothetical protein
MELEITEQHQKYFIIDSQQQYTLIEL